jgi:putative acetyltransferase
VGIGDGLSFRRRDGDHSLVRIDVPANQPHVVLRVESAGDAAAIAEVNRLAFGQKAEAQLVQELRDGGYVRLSLVAEWELRIVGHILFSQIAIITPDGDSLEAVSLAPMAVLPEFQRRGVGSLLVREALAQLQRNGQRIVVVLGHPEYYPRFGFSAELARPLACPYDVPPAAWLALELAPNSLRDVVGRVEYSPPFAAVT